MSDLEIRGGGAIAVDTDTLRHTAALFIDAADVLESIRNRVGMLRNQIAYDLGFDATVLGSMWALCDRLLDAVTEGDGIAGALREAAGVYELVELNAQYWAARAVDDTAAVARIEARVDALTAQHPGSFGQARFLEFERAVMWPSHLVRQATELGFMVGEEAGEKQAVWGGAIVGGLTIAGAMTTGFGRFGLLSRSARLTDRGTHPFTLVPLPPSTTATTAPTTLSGALQRMPGVDDSRVRVERYTMPDGSRQFAVYITGTQSMGVGGGDDAWDNASNVELYGGAASASYEATLAALEAAGAEPGDAVQAFGHSQGGMIATYLALDSDYDVQTLVTLGSPVSGDVGPGTLSVEIRHTDDPVAALAGGGHMGSVGAEGSFVVLREADPASGISDVQLGAHLMPAYLETAALVDASGDPRVATLGEALSGLAGAEEVEVFEFGAERG